MNFIGVASFQMDLYADSSHFHLLQIDRLKLTNWRPIALLNINYKIFAKAMQRCLQSFVGGAT